jgi:hypothetical protein
MGSILDSIADEERRKKIDKRTSRLMIEQMMQEVVEDVMQVFDFGAKKHPDSGEVPNFLTENGNKCALRDRGSSCLRHSAELLTGRTEDEESHLSPALHLIASASILYIRQKRNIIHGEDG